jgi:hypothetical protein
MVQIKLQSGSTLNIKSLTFKGSITDSNGKDTGGYADFVFIESEVNALESKLNTIGLSVQSLYDSVFSPIEEEQPEKTE